MTASMNVRVRFAPSPTGDIHIGNVRTALWDWLFARHYGGACVLRIEDTDKNREVQGGVQTIIESLRWYGIDFDEGPGFGGDYGPYVQSERLPLYKRYADQLVESGHAYRAYDTPDELAKVTEDQQRRGLPTGYNRRHRYLSDTERAEYERTRGDFAVVRFAAPREGQTVVDDAVYGAVTFENKVLQDHVLLKSDGYPTYHLAAQVDDHLMRISHVFRGEDWMPSAPLHVLINEALGFTPPIYVHLPNILGKNGKKLSKRKKEKPEGSAEPEQPVMALEFARAGYLQEAMVNYLAMQGWSPKDDQEIFSREELVERFGIEGILKSSPIWDPEKLLWYNGQYIRRLSLADLAERTLPYLQAHNLASAEPEPPEKEYIGRVLSLEQERMKTLAEAPQLADFFLLGDDAYPFDDKAVAKWIQQPAAKDRLDRVRAGFADLQVFDEASTEAVVRAVVSDLGVKGGEIIHLVRVAVSGRTTGPGLFETIAVLGKERVLRRLDRARTLCTH